MSKESIEIGDIVSVNCNNAQITITPSAEVLYIPLSSGDGWRFKDLNNGNIIEISEGCTVIKEKQK